MAVEATSATDEILIPQPVRKPTVKVAESASERQNMGSDAFLRLLVVKLQNQDPTAPATDTEFIEQLATFSSLEQLTSINKGIAELKAAIAELKP
jgi:flagellar basal-body rod modification protein FlgD